MQPQASTRGRYSHAIGVDGCAAGWVVCIVPMTDGSPEPLRAMCRVVERFPTLLEDFSRAAIAVDMPIGLPDVPERGGRACDRLARAILPANRKSSIFSPPTRAALRAGMAELARSGSRSRARLEASRVNQSLAPRGVQARIGAQCFGIFPKLAEVDAIMTPALPQCIVEAHPEIIFDLLANGRPIARKKEPAGVAQRTQLLRDAGFTTASTLVERTRAKGVATDDVLDAIACAFTACRVSQSRAERFGGTQTSASGITSAIWR